MTPIDVLRRARTLIETRGWVQEAYENSEGCCLDGALMIASDYPDTLFDSRATASYHVARELVREEIRDMTGVGDIIGWNDDPDRTKDDVTEVLDTVIAEVEQ